MTLFAKKYQKYIFEFLMNIYSFIYFGNFPFKISCNNCHQNLLSEVSIKIHLTLKLVQIYPNLTFKKKTGKHCFLFS